MPLAAYQQCRYPRCPNYATHQGFCSTHAQAEDRPGHYPGLHNSNRRFRRLRHSYLLRHPWCAHCKKAVATVLDHRIPHQGNARLFWSQHNWQGLCEACNTIKTALERQGEFAPASQGQGRAPR